ncbi:NlpC/P60 family protein [Pseudovibrio sp. SPO723]|uniref:NlpC/P60 family protein n=1 Tax=Nesiotobacter zosterae TaxID=392721 RepID=UPI0029C12D4A|nr:NlpC/P60 family protein [Pseudovibrio sp. SPO723]MDX5595580.1 NlpC/P60 family protein [Pseudovibrio sp. SPO723]
MITERIVPPVLVANEAREWLGTPYIHRGSLKGVGCDCLGLLRGLYRIFYGAEPMRLPFYAPEWAEVSDRDTLLAAARHYLVERSGNEPECGDILLFRWRAECPCKHIGIMSGPDRFIHAYEAVGTVESALVPTWKNRIAARFAFPETQKHQGEAGEWQP